MKTVQLDSMNKIGSIVLESNPSLHKPLFTIFDSQEHSAYRYGCLVLSVTSI